MKIEEILKNTPLETRLNVTNEMGFIDLLTKLGFRENKMWTNDENDLLKKLCDAAKEHTINLMQNIKSWENDGKPSDPQDTLDFAEWWRMWYNQR